MSFKNIFISIFIGTSLIISALIINSKRPEVETSRPTPDYVRASGRCAQCHRQETSAIVHQFEQSTHAAEGVNCLDCHKPLEGQTQNDHRGFLITSTVTSKNCTQCHQTQYDQFIRSRHAAPAWAAVRGSQDFTDEQIDFAETYHKGAVDRPANALALLQGSSSIESGCLACHSIGKPNDDDSIGDCTACHARHSTSISLAREPATCGQCHMGPDHAQLEIYNESKHGVLFNAQRQFMNLNAPPKNLTTADMPVPTCATCHMSGLEGLKFTHDVTERLSYWLFAPVSEKRPGYERGKNEMKEVCLKCHAKPHVDEFYTNAEAVVLSTNEKVKEAQNLMAELRSEGLLTPEPFDEHIEFLYFDFWHYFGRTAKHGAYMGGADFVQWHGNYELLLMMTQMKEIAEQMRKKQ
ncbi:ammonia-forming cytochrome c nitrite reductase subunit c552 [candidate division KSB1 bacterium]|nr:ammonia-forming cytochrome c nitrite reductase subunit c552 [candidate division KSB1 bacterium]